ncbi:hypothetical protein BH09MYX1_BH09MYX1_45060 [soil metagenome]
MAAARRRSLADEAELEAKITPPPESARDELYDFPAAVVCALCGGPDCPGCAEERSRSGVISIVAWERPGGSLGRLWATSKAATLNAEAFFESLPDGPIASAFRFALLAEVVAATSMLVLVGGTLVALLLAFGGVASLDGAAIGFACRAAFASVCGLALLLVAAHAAHGLALGLGAQRSGAKASLTRSLRFGLYSAGWDLVLGPIGFLGLLRSKISIVNVAVGLPTRASIAFLKGTYRLEGDAAKPALHASYVAAIVATLLCACAMLGGLAFVILR